MERLKEIERQIERAVEDYRKAVREIRTSDDPIYNDPAKQDYEIKKLRTQLDEGVAELRAKYQAEADALIAEAEKKAALSVVGVGESDMAIVNQRIDEFTADVALAYSTDDKLAAYERLVDALKFFDLPKLYHLRRSLPGVISKVGDDRTILRKLRELNSALQELHTPEQERLAELRELKRAGGDIAYMTLRLTEGRAHTDITQGGISMEAYMRRMAR